ncbi:MAG: RNA polymerase sigma factor [Bacteroidales bacterium]|jgi:RNA polymerase sigma-70 factor (ECF subfamily)|nr:RNA polymerase sigma factor [Bacteroidales bacterium]
MEDKDILEIYEKEGKKEYAFNLIVRKYSDRLYWHLRELTFSHEDSNDLLQTTLIKTWKYLPNFRGDSSLYTWLYRIATNEALTFLKKKRLRALVSLSDYDSVMEENLKSDPSFNGSRLQMNLQKAILSLPDKQRAVFSLRYFQEMKYEDISKTLNTSIGALKASYHHAYHKVKSYMEEHTDE